VPLDASVPTTASAPTPDVELLIPVAEVPAPVTIAVPVEVPAVAPVEVPAVAPVEVPTAAVPTGPEVVAPTPAPAAPSSTSRSKVSFAATSLVALSLGHWLM
jgi:hypothetical protein